MEDMAEVSVSSLVIIGNGCVFQRRVRWEKEIGHVEAARTPLVATEEAASRIGGVMVIEEALETGVVQVIEGLEIGVASEVGVALEIEEVLLIVEALETGVVRVIEGLGIEAASEIKEVLVTIAVSGRGVEALTPEAAHLNVLSTFAILLRPDLWPVEKVRVPTPGRQSLDQSRDLLKISGTPFSTSHPTEEPQDLLPTEETAVASAREED